MLRISGGWFSVRLIRELDVFSFFSRFLGVRLIRECVLYAQIYGTINIDETVLNTRVDIKLIGI